MNENWKPSAIFPEMYLVSENGKVYGKSKRRVLKPAEDRYGYLYYVLCVNKKRITVKAHRLVAMTFIPNEQGKTSIDHLNGDRKDNRVCNLRWVTNKENSNNEITLQKLRLNAEKNMAKMREGARRINYNRKRVLITKENGEQIVCNSLKDAAAMLGENYSKLSERVNGKRPQKCGAMVAFV